MYPVLNGSSSMNISDDSDLAVVGEVTVGANASTCMDNGREALSQDGKIAVASSVTVFIVASILFFIVGFLCGHYCQNKRKQSSAAGETVPSASGQTQIPYYDDVVLEQEVELKENVAYGPLQ